MTVKDVADTVQAFVAAGGIVVGGIFTYYKFVKDRIYRPRLDLGIDVERLRLAEGHFLVCRVSIQNKGATKLSVRHEGTALIVRPGMVDGEPLRAARWSGYAHSAVVDIFADHDWIESTETVRDDAVVAIEADPDRFYRVELRIVVEHPSPRSSRNITISSARVIAGPTGPASSPSVPSPR